MSLSDWIAAIALFASTVLALLALNKGNANSSAALTFTLSEAFRETWTRYHQAAPADKEYVLGELMNVVENTATFYHQGVFTGLTKESQKAYLIECLDLIDSKPGRRAEVKALLTSDTTLSHARKFAKDNKIQLFD